jgi:predicted transporter
VASTCGFVFAFLSGFSIGRFISLLPLMVTAFAVTRDRPPPLQLAAQLSAIGLYFLLAWVVAEQVHFWGIQIELPLCLVAYAAAAIFPPPARALRRSVN